MYPAALLNHGYEDYISFVGLPETKTVQMVKGLKLAPGNIPDMSQNFYYGEVVMTVYKPFPYSFSFYCAYYGYMDGFSFINFAETGDSYGSKYPVYKTISSAPFTIHGITCQTNLNCIQDGVNTYLSFNNDLTYDKYRRYGLYNGVYTIFNIPKQYPITLINKGKENLVSLKSLKTDCTTLGLGPDNNIYTFYWGTVSVTVYGNFGQMSLYSTHQGYTGASGIFIYDSIYDNSLSYPDPLSVPTITPVLTANTTFTESIVYTDTYTKIELKRVLETVISYSLFSNIITNVSGFYNVISLTNVINAPGQNNTASDLNKYTLKTGMYILRCPGYFIALLNNGKKDSIIYQGTVSKTAIGRDGNTYSFFENQILVSVFSNFGYITVDVLGTTFKGNYILSYDI